MRPTNRQQRISVTHPNRGYGLGMTDCESDILDASLSLSGFCGLLNSMISSTWVLRVPVGCTHSKKGCSHLPNGSTGYMVQLMNMRRMFRSDCWQFSEKNNGTVGLFIHWLPKVDSGADTAQTIISLPSFLLRHSSWVALNDLEMNECSFIPF